MSSRSPQLASDRRRLFSFLAAVSPLRYGVVAVIVVTVGYTFLRVFPMLRHNLELLRNVNAVDEQGMRLEGDLQVEIQESRRRFLRAMLAAAPLHHAMPPGGFRLAVVNCWDLEAGRRVRAELAALFGLRRDALAS